MTMITTNITMPVVINSHVSIFSIMLKILLRVFAYVQFTRLGVSIATILTLMIFTRTLDPGVTILAIIRIM
jgi:hypothetical protein